MRLGLVRFLNARPLDYGFRRDFPAGDLVEDTPARLVTQLLAGELDAALISSVECFRNADRLAFSRSVGVCATREVRSILFFTRKSDSIHPTREALDRIYVDRGSRSSVALLNILLRRSLADASAEIAPPPFEERPPETIPDLVQGRTAGLLIGDAAMEFRHGPRYAEFDCRDLASWWYEREQLPFVFALWAFPHGAPLPDEFFEKSLENGLEHLDEIARLASYPGGLEYLRDILHYKLYADDQRSLDKFYDYLQKESAGIS